MNSNIKTTFHFVRHGEIDRNAKGKLPDGIDHPLNEKGTEQAKEIVRVIPQNIDVVVSSPLIRAVQTRSIVVDQLGYPVLIEESDERIGEVDFGILKGKTWEEATTLFPNENTKEKYHQQEYDFTAHGGDSFTTTYDRVYAFIHDMKEKYPDKNILVITHGGVIRCVYKKEKNYGFPDAPSNASVHTFEL